MSLSLTQLTDDAATLARTWMAATAAGQTAAERRTTHRLAQLVSDPAGLEFAVRFVDRVARPDDLQVAAHELAELRSVASAPGAFLNPVDRLLVTAGTIAAPLLPGVVVPAARTRLRQLVGHLVVDDGPRLAKHIAKATADGFRLNINLLGEAVLGQQEAGHRAERILALIARPDISYVSVKTSAVVSQLSTWDTADSTERVLETVRPLYLAAKERGTFINLDMEEYHDLDLTVAVFLRLMEDPELLGLEMGIVLQAYLPDSGAALDVLTEAATARRTAGGARVKVRLVKGANLAMEKVDAELHGWEQAPYDTKPDVDANYVRVLDRALDPARTDAVRIGVASHNLFDVALAHLMASDRGVSEALDVEMLQGMAPAQARAVRDAVGQVVLYTPVVAKKDFDVAVSYLVRRLEENSASQNFVHALFAGDETSGEHAEGGTPMDHQEQAFRDSVAASETVSTTPRRAERPAPATLVAGQPFVNAPDTDPAVESARAWAHVVVSPETAARLAASVPEATVLAVPADVDSVVARAAEVAGTWRATTGAQRREVLLTAARLLEEARTDLVGTMVHEARKTVGEADPEVSEAVDFAAFYAESAAQLDEVPGATFTPEGLTVVTPPWNFPVAIPLGSVLGPLAAGSPVIIKPSHVTPRCAAVGVDAIRRALVEHGYEADLVQLVSADEGEVGRRLVTHPEVSRVVLTGSIETAELFAGWRPDLHVFAETSGKNTLVVTAAADIDLAVKDIVRSAFGHAGQKCSAASLLVLVGAVGRSARLHRQLVDAVRSLAVGPATELATTTGPLTVEPGEKLHRALTTLDEGERWVVEPREVPGTDHLWTPGVKAGVQPGSWFHLTEVFGPVLGIVRVDTLDEALEVQNAVSFGLTGGIHSLDEAEIAHWLENVQVGNAYINRHITGAIVQRQPFGGWKASVVGPGAKAGGPSYVAQFGDWSDDASVPDRTSAPEEWLAWAAADDAAWWEREMGVEHDPTGLDSESNVLRYRPVPTLTVRVAADAVDIEADRVLHAASVAGVPVTVSSAEVEDAAAFAARVAAGEVEGRIRVVGSEPGLREAAASHVGSVTVLDAPVVASGRRELMTVVREQAVSQTRHRYGHLERG
ncbi:NAD-dependent aldehyde dehydrogenase [Sanguibacter keddieii DSM 10542]|uniref:L-glutamate gamma-semialdehyde dehydrogenase n=1 Tax=Sanguibacter keddieii (strain ATCC 51767 / DSM 10542 / NCFB 3025 / ST-74) TaxID=446469 RepID=D1BE21_SANKS|nr:bifunctional proline dehydrogenase/L-glutamate gamma-semialdehyde dehydrogenase [Sanguibacter keddieii]ACZ23242.1 NAD-dependent aldehyde dehydrogenase [Sanguibacter keddieii DSM 10542]